MKNQKRLRGIGCKRSHNSDAVSIRPDGPSIKRIFGLFMKLPEKIKSNGSPKQRKLRTIKENGDHAVELNALSLGALFALVAGGFIDGFAPTKDGDRCTPNLERDKTLAEARHRAMLDDIDKHLTATKDTLTELADRQDTLAAALRGEQTRLKFNPNPVIRIPFCSRATTRMLEGSFNNQAGLWSSKKATSIPNSCWILAPSA